MAHWHVDDLKATLDRLIAMGATEYQPVTDHSQGKGTFVTASVADPFGNILGIMTNVHYLDILKQKNA
ncbi:MAG: VOC family protein [Ferruginibacter sp.]